MPRFLGRYLHSIDEKGRVPLPARFRNGEALTEFVLVRGANACLYLYPEEAWRPVGERLRLMRNGGDPDGRRQALAITANAAELTLDKHGRLTLPQPLMEVAGLGHEAVFVGAGEIVEIWNPQRFDEYIDGGETGYDQIAAAIL